MQNWNSFQCNSLTVYVTGSIFMKFFISWFYRNYCDINCSSLSLSSEQLCLSYNISMEVNFVFIALIERFSSVILDVSRSCMFSFISWIFFVLLIYNCRKVRSIQWSWHYRRPNVLREVMFVLIFPCLPVVRLKMGGPNYSHSPCPSCLSRQGRTIPFLPLPSPFTMTHTFGLAEKPTRLQFLACICPHYLYWSPSSDWLTTWLVLCPGYQVEANYFVGYVFCSSSRVWLLRWFCVTVTK